MNVIEAIEKINRLEKEISYLKLASSLIQTKDLGEFWQEDEARKAAGFFSSLASEKTNELEQIKKMSVSQIR